MAFWEDCGLADVGGYGLCSLARLLAAATADAAAVAVAAAGVTASKERAKRDGAVTVERLFSPLPGRAGRIREWCTTRWR